MSASLLRCGLLVGLLMSPAAWAQADPATATDPAVDAAADPSAPPAEPPPPPPTIDEALTFLNELLARNPSPWRPCRGASTVELSADGYLSVVVERDGYCEHSRVRVHVRDLVPQPSEVVLEDRGAISLPCRGGDLCGRYSQKRKIRDEDAWRLRDDDWLPKGPLDQPHQVDQLTVVLASDAQAARLAVSSLTYIVRSAAQDPAYAPPADPFDGRIAAGPVADASTATP